MLQPTTELDAVNTMLEAVGEPPVNSIEETEGTEAAVAYRILLECSRTIQSTGLSFNKEPYELLPDTDGIVYLPDNTLRVTPVDRRYVERGRKLYDRVDGTYRIGSSVKAVLVRFLAFEHLPEVARYYIMITAARKFAARTVSSGELVGLTERDEAEARVLLKDYELEQDQTNLFNVVDRGIIYRELGPNDTRGAMCH